MESMEEPQDLVAAEDLVEELVSVFSHMTRLEARATHLLGRVGQTGAFKRDGYSSPTAMLKHRLSLHPGEAQRLVMRANALPDVPLTAMAYERSALSGAQVDVLLQAKFTAPDAFTGAEADLVADAMDTPLVRDLRKHVDYWLQGVAADEVAAEKNIVRELRSLTIRRDGEMIRFNGWFDIEAGERLIAELDPGPPAQEDDRPTPVRRADLLLDIFNGAADRPNLTVHVSAESLTDGLPGISETSNGTFLTIDEIKRLACDAKLNRVIFDPESQPLDVGRMKRLVTPAMRIAIAARDLRCAFCGCDRPSHWCDVHHLIHWTDGGETNIENLVLLCRHHHVLVHEAGWKITGKPGDLHFFRPDGSELGSDRSPKHQRPTDVPAPKRAERLHIDVRSVIRQMRGAAPPNAP